MGTHNPPLAPLTVTTCFKQPPGDCVPEAWRILRAMYTSREMCPSRATQYHSECLKWWEKGNGDEEGNAGDEMAVEVEPGSASSPRALPAGSPHAGDGKAVEVSPGSAISLRRSACGLSMGRGERLGELCG